jgi:hypothetical protein
MKNFQVLKNNNDGTIDIEIPTYTRATFTHPKDSNGNLVSGSSLIYSINRWISENYPNTTGDLDANAFDFNQEFQLDVEYESSEVLPEIIGTVVDFPVEYTND